MKSVADVDQANLCIGCGMCVAIAGEDAIELQIGSDGFYHPTPKQENPTDWQEIKHVCPGITLRQPQKPRNTDEKVWGPIEKIWIGHATDEEIRWQASSGGGVTGLLHYLLEKNVATCALHIGASSSEPFLNVVAASRNRADILQRAGSRYAPAAPLTSIKTILTDPSEKLAFVGKPCDVAALKAYLELHPEFKERIAIIITFMCAGTPSMKGTEALISALDVEPEKVKEFWYRGHGWPGKATAVDQQGNKFSLSYKESWGSILNRHLHFRCKICPDGIGALADVTFGDAWEDEAGYPSFEEKPGQSLIMARNDKGKQIIEQAVAFGYLSVEDYSLDKLKSIQPYQYNRRKFVGSRLLALKVAGYGYPRFYGFNLFSNFLSAGLKTNVKNFLGTLDRINPPNRLGYTVLKSFEMLKTTAKKVIKKL